MVEPFLSVKFLVLNGEKFSEYHVRVIQVTVDTSVCDVTARRNYP